jgi:hypothetical protein
MRTPCAESSCGAHVLRNEWRLFPEKTRAPKRGLCAPSPAADAGRGVRIRSGCCLRGNGNARPAAPAAARGGQPDLSVTETDRGGRRGEAGLSRNGAGLCARAESDMALSGAVACRHPFMWTVHLAHVCSRRRPPQPTRTNIKERRSVEVATDILTTGISYMQYRYQASVCAVCGSSLLVKTWRSQLAPPLLPTTPGSTRRAWVAAR